MIFDLTFRYLLVLATIVLMLGIWRGDKIASNYFALSNSKDNLTRVVEKLTQETKYLELEIYKIKNYKSYAEKIYKDKYHITGEHENIIFFAD